MHHSYLSFSRPKKKGYRFGIAISHNTINLDLTLFSRFEACISALLPAIAMNSRRSPRWVIAQTLGILAPAAFHIFFSTSFHLYRLRNFTIPDLLYVMSFSPVTSYPQMFLLTLRWCLIKKGQKVVIN